MRNRCSSAEQPPSSPESAVSFWKPHLADRTHLRPASSLNFESDVNLFRKMSDNYMTDFKEKIDDLVDDLEAVKSETDEVEQCKMLSKIFGDDFPIPEKKNAAKKQMNFIPSTSASGVD